MFLITFGLILLTAIISLQPSLQFNPNTNENVVKARENNENWQDVLSQLRATFEKRGFTSLGWGPGGLPYADNYYHEFSHENVVRKIKQRQLDNKLSGDIIIEPLALPLSTGKKTVAENAEMKAVKVKVHMPSLFKSYGWLPAGQK